MASPTLSYSEKPGASLSDERQTKDCYDMAIVGAGISCAYVFVHFLSLLEQQPPANPVKVVVMEKSGEFWSGVPYGRRSGRHALLISSLREFLPEKQEREDFARWLSENRDRVFGLPDTECGELANEWLRTNEGAMAEGRWDDLFVPRYTFGLYIQQRLAALIERATASGILVLSLLAADVLDIQRWEDLYRVDVAPSSGSGGALLAKKLILTIGSPPNATLKRPAVDAAGEDVCFVENMYEPSLEANIQRIGESLRRSGDGSDRQVLILGANAGALEALYSLTNSAWVNGLISKFLVLSPSAAFPHRISRDPKPTNYCPEHLMALVSAKALTAKQILEAIKKDVAEAAAQNLNIADLFGEFSRGMIAALNQLGLEEQKEFVAKYGVEIGKLQRRAGSEYLDLVERLTGEGRIEMLQGKFVSYLLLGDAGPGCEFVSSKNEEWKVLAAPIRVIVNCAGFQDVTEANSPLIQNLLRRQICVPNTSKRGFLINENFEASKNCYVMGPLVAGNLAGRLRVWHAESVARIISMSRQLAEVLLKA